MRGLSRAFAAALTLIVAGCASRSEPPTAPVLPPPPQVRPIPTPEPPAPLPPADARQAGVTLVEAPAFDGATATGALRAFRLSCPSLQRRTDRSGLTRPGDWTAVCREAAAVDPADAATFFATRFDWVRVGDGNAFATGYYEPEIHGSRVRITGYDTPVFGKPASLIRCTRADGTNGRGRIDEVGQCAAFHSRGEIEDGALAGENPIAWVADPIELFFLQVQGSGRLRAPDGSVMRIGYADQNGHGYVAIGRLLRERGVLPPGGATMDGIIAWMKAQPDGGKSLMRENPSYVFFRELTGAGPLGAMEVPVTPQVSVATDPLFVPLGAPVFLTLDAFSGRRLWVAQDTGGAIKGANRFDTFWGAGEAARMFAGGLSSKGQALVLLPKGAVERIAGDNAPAER